MRDSYNRNSNPNEAYAGDTRARRLNEKMMRNSIRNGSVITMLDDFKHLSNAEYHRRLKNVFYATLIASTVAMGALNIEINKIVDFATMCTLINDFNIEMIVPEKHRTDNRQYFFFDYDDLATKVMQSEDADRSIYLLYRNIGSQQTDLVLEHTHFRSFSNYLSQKGYSSDDLDRYKRDMDEYVLRMEDIAENQREIDEIVARQHPDTEDIGGRSL